MPLRALRLILVSFKSMWAGGKNTRSARKNTVFEQAIPDPENPERAHIVPAVDLLVTHYTFSLQWGKTVIIHVKARARHLPFLFLCMESTAVLGFQTFTFRKKVNAGLVPLQCMCVCFSPK